MHITVANATILELMRHAKTKVHSVSLCVARRHLGIPLPNPDKIGGQAHAHSHVRRPFLERNASRRTRDRERRSGSEPPIRRWLRIPSRARLSPLVDATHVPSTRTRSAKRTGEKRIKMYLRVSYHVTGRLLVVQFNAVPFSRRGHNRVEVFRAHRLLCCRLG